MTTQARADAVRKLIEIAGRVRLATEATSPVVEAIEALGDAISTLAAEVFGEVYAIAENAE